MNRLKIEEIKRRRYDKNRQIEFERVIRSPIERPITYILNKQRNMLHHSMVEDRQYIHDLRNTHESKTDRITLSMLPTGHKASRIVFQHDGIASKNQSVNAVPRSTTDKRRQVIVEAISIVSEMMADEPVFIEASIYGSGNTRYCDMVNDRLKQFKSTISLSVLQLLESAAQRSCKTPNNIKKTTQLKQSPLNIVAAPSSTVFTTKQKDKACHKHEPNALNILEVDRHKKQSTTNSQSKLCLNMQRKCSDKRVLDNGVYSQFDSNSIQFSSPGTSIKSNRSKCELVPKPSLLPKFASSVYGGLNLSRLVWKTNVGSKFESSVVWQNSPTELSHKNVCPYNHSKQSNENQQPINYQQAYSSKQFPACKCKECRSCFNHPNHRKSDLNNFQSRHRFEVPAIHTNLNDINQIRQTQNSYRISSHSYELDNMKKVVNCETDRHPIWDTPEALKTSTNFSMFDSKLVLKN